MANSENDRHGVASECYNLQRTGSILNDELAPDNGKVTSSMRCFEPFATGRIRSWRTIRYKARCFQVELLQLLLAMIASSGRQQTTSQVDRIVITIGNTLYQPFDRLIESLHLSSFYTNRTFKSKTADSRSLQVSQRPNIESLTEQQAIIEIDKFAMQKLTATPSQLAPVRKMLLKPTKSLLLSFHALPFLDLIIGITSDSKPMPDRKSLDYSL